MSSHPVSEAADHAGTDPTASDPPVTGLPAVDEALRRLGDLDEKPVSEHHDALAGAHEILHTELQTPPDQTDGSSAYAESDPQPAVTGASRPGCRRSWPGPLSSRRGRLDPRRSGTAER